MPKDCGKCRFYGKVCSGRDPKRTGVPYPWNQWLKEDAELFHDDEWYFFPEIDFVQGPAPKAIPLVDGRIAFNSDPAWVGIRVAQVFETKRRKGGWKTACSLRSRLEIPASSKLYFLGTAKDDQLSMMVSDPDWAHKLREYGIDYASPPNWSMYLNSTSCQLVWSILMSWRTAVQLSKAGIKVVPNVDGPPHILSLHKKWATLRKFPVLMTNFQMVYNKFAYVREALNLFGFTETFAPAQIILNGVTHPERIAKLSQIYPFSFVSGVLYTKALYRQRWKPQTGFVRDLKADSVDHVFDLFGQSFREWSQWIAVSQGG